MGPQGPTEPQGELGAALDWSAVIEYQNLDDVGYAIGVQVQGKNYILGSGFVVHFWNAVWTNARVVQAVLISTGFIEDLNPRTFAVKSGTVIGGANTYWLQNFWVHPGYYSTVGSSDAALLTIDVNLPQTPFFLPRDQVQGLTAGQSIGSIWFLEELTEEPVNVPIATLKDGTISSLRPFADEVQTPANSRVIQHNLDLSGRTSGSLIYDHQSYIIGMNFARIYQLAYDQRTCKSTRIVSENLALAIRVDELWRLFDLASGASRIVAVVSANGADVPFVLVSERGYPYDVYMAFTDSWDGETILL